MREKYLLDEEVKCILSSFADDNELGGAADCLEGQEGLQCDILAHWMISNNMKFKKKVLGSAPGWSNVRHKNRWLENSSAERDLGYR